MRNKVVISENLISKYMPFDKEPLKAELNELATNLFNLFEKIALLSRHYPSFELRDWHTPFYQWGKRGYLPLIKEALSIRKLVGQYYQLQQPLRDYQAFLELFIKEEINPITSDLCTILSQNKALFAGSNILVINSGKYDYAASCKKYAELEAKERLIKEEIANDKEKLATLLKKEPIPLWLCRCKSYKDKGLELRLTEYIVNALKNKYAGKSGHYSKQFGVIPLEQPLTRLKDNYHLRKS